MPKLVDLLDEDKPIAEQKFTCLSFVSPEYEIKNKNIFFFESFLKEYNFNKSMEKFVQFNNYLSFKYSIKSDELMEEYKQFVEAERPKLMTTCEDDYKTFLDKYSDQLDLEYNKQHEFQTSTRGIKIRGVFPTQEEAEMRAKMLRENDPFFDVYVGPVGLWMPWEPDAYKTGNINFLEDQLNDLMANKKKNEETAKEYFDQRVRESKRKAIEENVKRARESGNKLTQTIDKNDNLVNVKNAVVEESITNELFGENVR